MVKVDLVLLRHINKIGEIERKKPRDWELQRLFEVLDTLDHLGKKIDEERLLREEWDSV